LPRPDSPVDLAEDPIETYKLKRTENLSRNGVILPKQKTLSRSLSNITLSARN
jgi:hypothetical protein